MALRDLRSQNLVDMSIDVAMIRSSRGLNETLVMVLL